MAKKKAIAVKRQTSDAKLIGATVTTSDRTAGKWKRTDARDLSRRVGSMVMWCAYFNATNCVQHRMRLMRRSDATGKKLWAGRAITNPRKVKYLNDRRIGVKAASYMEDAGDAEEVVRHPALDLLNNANPWQRGSTFSKACFMQWELYGRRYIHVVQAQGTEPSELFPLFTDKVRPIPDVKGLLSGYVYGRDTPSEQEFKLDEIMWQQYFPNPVDPFGGLSPLHCCFQEADIYAASTTSELTMWNKGARPDFAVKVAATTTDPQLKQMRAEIEARHQGPSKRGDFWFFREGEVVPLQFTQKEMEYLAGRQDIRAMIGAAYGIPETFWRMNDANLAGSQTAQEFYARWTVAPRLAQDAEEWTETLLPLYGIEPGEYWFVYDDPVPENRAEIRADVKDFVTLGVWSKAYALELVGGRSPEDDGEEAPLIGVQPKPENGEDGAGPKKPKPGKEKFAPLPRTKVLALNDVSDGPDQPKLSTMQTLEKALRQWFDWVAKDVALPATPAEFTGEQLAPFLSKFLDAVAEPIISLVFDAGSIAFESIATPTTAVRDALTKDAADYARTSNLRLAGSVSETQTETIRNAIAEGVAAGKPQAETAQAIRQVLTADGPVRATTITRTESQKAHQNGKLAGWKAGKYWGSKWKLAPGACPMCVAFVKQFGDTRPFGEPFCVKGSTLVVGGKTITFDYDDVMCAGCLHPNDRCYAQPIEKEPTT